MAAPLSAAVALGRSTDLREPSLLGGTLHWLEQRPDEGGRTTLMRRDADGTNRELTPGDWDLRSKVHGYGGGTYAPGPDGMVVAVAADQSLWHLGTPPRRLVPPLVGRAFGGGLIDGRRERWIGVMEQEEQDALVAVPLAGGEPVPLHGPVAFCADPVLSADGRALAWVQWQPPFMPWERSTLWLAAINGRGELESARPVAGGTVSVFQPLWAGNDLVVANDRSGWWNLECLPQASALAGDPGQAPRWQPLLPMEAEFGLPQWTLGMATTAWDGERLVAAACREGCWQLGRLLPAEGGAPLAAPLQWQPIDQPFDDLAGLSAWGGRLVAVASHASSPIGLLDIRLSDGHWSHRPGSAPPLAADAISRPQPLWFVGAGGAPTHAWFYPPGGGSHGAAPLLVRAHSGPTGMARTGLNPVIQFWTSRGWGVVDVNYGGSSGFGRAYRQRLDGGWGVVDVADCAAAAAAVVAAGWGAADRVAMDGGSAAGFTVLAALCFGDWLGAGSCRYAVSDPAGLAATSDHRFEARYLDHLIGPWPEARRTYEERSPLLHADRIQAPVIFFHGLNDRVVPPEQTQRMADALSKRGIPVQLHLFADEGHGFRSGEVQQQVLEATEAFFRRHLRINP